MSGHCRNCQEKDATIVVLNAAVGRVILALVNLSSEHRAVGYPRCHCCDAIYAVLESTREEVETDHPAAK